MRNKNYKKFIQWIFFNIASIILKGYLVKEYDLWWLAWLLYQEDLATHPDSLRFASSTGSCEKIGFVWVDAIILYLKFLNLALLCRCSASLFLTSLLYILPCILLFYPASLVAYLWALHPPVPFRPVSSKQWQVFYVFRVISSWAHRFRLGFF